MSNLNQISLMLGEVRGELKGLSEQLAAHEKRTCRNFTVVQGRLAKVDKSINRLADVERSIRDIKPVVENYKRLRWAVGGFVAALGVVGGLVGSVAGQVFKWFT